MCKVDRCEIDMMSWWWSLRYDMKIDEIRYDKIVYDKIIMVAEIFSLTLDFRRDDWWQIQYFNTCKLEMALMLERWFLRLTTDLFINCIEVTDANLVIYTFVTLQIDSLMRLYVGNSESLRLSNLLCRIFWMTVRLMITNTNYCLRT